MKPHLIIFTFIFIVCRQITGQVPDSIKFRSLQPYDFHLTYLREEKVILIDVREPFEFRSTRIKDALNIPSSANLEFTADTIDKKYSLFLYCTTDFRSKRVAKYFCDKGFNKVYSLDGGIVAWKNDGFPVDKKRLHDKKHKKQGTKK